MSAHLGDLVSALADGQLRPQETERALAHVAACDLCAGELAAARASRRRLSGACEVLPTPELTERLLALSASIPSTEGDPLRAPDRDTAWAAPEAWRTTLTGDVAGEARRRRRRRALLAGAGGVGVLGCALFVLGQAPTVTPDPSRAAALTTLAGSGAVGVQEVSTMQEDGLTEAGYVVPEGLPASYEVSAVRHDGDVVELELTGPDGTVMVREQPGRLDTSTATTTFDGAPGHRVVVLSRDPWHIAWQAGDLVVEVTTDAPRDVLEPVVAALPARDYDAGVLPRLTRGWSTMTGAIFLP
ncbi:zf-HC2 domain-containing protein [Isoptericola jiangsuensis]|uniref:zf-HC2 domain-containing protein n=1 Tax=Isoptericola jiangsuensis TaxID=548579 RepID=UPI003AAB48D5